MATPDTARPEAGANASDQAWLSLLGRLTRVTGRKLPRR